MIADIRIPSLLKIGGGAFGEVAPILTRLGCKRTLIVTDAFMMSRGLPDQLRAEIESAGMECGVFTETVADPTTDVIASGVKTFLGSGYDSLVSLGGGSPMDTAKAIGMLAANGGRCRDYKVPNLIPHAGASSCSDSNDGRHRV